MYSWQWWAGTAAVYTGDISYEAVRETWEYITDGRLYHVCSACMSRYGVRW